MPAYRESLVPDGELQATHPKDESPCGVSFLLNRHSSDRRLGDDRSRRSSHLGKELKRRGMSNSNSLIVKTELTLGFTETASSSPIISHHGAWNIIEQSNHLDFVSDGLERYSTLLLCIFVHSRWECICREWRGGTRKKSHKHWEEEKNSQEK